MNRLFGLVLAAQISFAPQGQQQTATPPLEVHFQQDGGVLVLPALINNVITLNFVLDSGSSDVSIPNDVVLTLRRTGALVASDFTGTTTYILADGSRFPSQTFRIRTLNVGGVVVKDVAASVAPPNAELLLGQSFLSRFKSWSIDNTRQVLLLDSNPQQMPSISPLALNKKEPAPASGMPQTVLPGSDPVIDQARREALVFNETLPQYLLKQFTTRYRANSASHDKTTWQAVDLDIADLRLEDGVEKYTNMFVNGKPAISDRIDNRGISSVLSDSGYRSAGEFSFTMQVLLSPGSYAQFTNQRLTNIVNRPAYRYDYVVEQPSSSWRVEALGAVIRPAYGGAIWIDKETSRVLRIEMAARNLWLGFPLDSVESAVDYNFVTIGEKKYFVPTHSDSLSCMRGTQECDRNVVDFRNYRIMPKSAPAQNILPAVKNPLDIGSGLSVAIVIDNSGNMRQFGQAAAKAALAVIKLLNPQDEICVVNFNQDAYLDVPLTSDLRILQSGLERADFRGGTAMRDAIRMSIDYLQDKARRERKVVIVLSGGTDDASSVTLGSLVQIAQKDRVPVYVIGLRGSDNSKEAAALKHDFNQLAESTGGRVFYLRDLSDAVKVAQELVGAIHHR